MHTMNGKLIFGISFQVFQVLLLAIIVLIGVFSSLNITKEVYYLVFGGIVLLGLNVLSFTSIFMGLNSK